jgi:hypothetical protein
MWNPYHFPQILHLSPWLADHDNAVIEPAVTHLIMTGFSAARLCSFVKILSSLHWVRRKLLNLTYCNQTRAALQQGISRWISYHLEDFRSERGGIHEAAVRQSHHWLLGGGIVVAHVGDLIGEACFAEEMGGDPIDVCKMTRIRHCASRSGWREAFKKCAPI